MSSLTKVNPGPNLCDSNWIAGSLMAVFLSGTILVFVNMTVGRESLVPVLASSQYPSSVIHCLQTEAFFKLMVVVL